MPTFAARSAACYILPLVVVVVVVGCFQDEILTNTVRLLKLLVPPGVAEERYQFTQALVLLTVPPRPESI